MRAPSSCPAQRIIGTAAGLDLNLYDSRVPAIVFANPARWQTSTNKIDRYHTVPMSDYYSEPTRTTVQALDGSYDGRIRRTALPPGGTIATDVAGTVQGAWLNPSQPTFPESPHFAIGPDNVDPTKLQLSMGTSQTGFLANLYYLGVPATSGFVNRDPAQITPGTQIYCYDFQNQYGMALLQLTDATTLKFEGRNGASRNCASEQPWAFSVSAVTFKR